MVDTQKNNKFGVLNKDAYIWFSIVLNKNFNLS
jgi:plasmid maintenance system killer protein